MRLATWNVNGIRARQVQFSEWVERDQPDVICLQELKAAPAQVPPATERTPRLLEPVARAKIPPRARLRSHCVLSIQPSALTLASCKLQVTLGTTVVISAYVPMGGKDFTAKIEFLHARKNMCDLS